MSIDVMGVYALTDIDTDAMMEHQFIAISENVRMFLAPSAFQMMAFSLHRCLNDASQRIKKGTAEKRGGEGEWE